MGVDPVTLALGASAVGSIWQGVSGNREGNRARRAQDNRQRDIDSATAPYMSRNADGSLRQPNSLWNTALGNNLTATQNRPIQQFAFDPSTANEIGTSLIDTRQFDPTQGGGTVLPDWMGETALNDPNTGQSFMDFSRLLDPSGMSTGANTSQDALMQLIRGGTGASIGGFNANARVDGIQADVNQTAQSSLEQLARDGSRFDLDAMFNALGLTEDRNRERSVAELQGSAGSIGQRFGTTMGLQEGRLRAQMEEDANLRRQGLARDSFESAQERRINASNALTAQDSLRVQAMIANQGNQAQISLGNVNARLGARGQDANVSIANANNQTSAASALAQLQGSLFNTQMSGRNAFNNNLSGMMTSQMDNATRIALGNQTASNNAMLSRNDFNQRGAQISQNDLGLLANILGQNASSANQMGQFNEANRINTGQFNTGMEFNNFQSGIQQGQFNQGIIQQLIQMGLGQENFADSRALQALGIRAGVPTAGANPNAGAVGGAVGDMGNLLLMMQMLGGAPRSSTQGAPRSEVTAGRDPNVWAPINPMTAMPAFR